MQISQENGVARPDKDVSSSRVQSDKWASRENCRT